jgi:hypothetical protein
MVAAGRYEHIKHTSTPTDPTMKIKPANHQQSKEASTDKVNKTMINKIE